MTSWIEIGLMNAAVATVLAVSVWLVTRIWRQPVFVHALWVLVLVKMITPPLVHVPWRVAATPTDLPSPAAADQPRSADPFDVAPPGPRLNATELNETELTAQPAIDFAPITAAGTDLPTLTKETPNAAQPSSDPRTSISWVAVVTATWLTGSVLFLIVSATRMLRFHRALTNAAPASDALCKLADQAAARFGLAGSYQLRITEGRLSPLVWPIGRPTIVLSRPLLAQLSTDETQLLLAHEFAHLRRKDHWVRWLELVAVTIYWWHPVAWWSRAMIRRTEERACDAWVAWAFPDSVRRYAAALLTAVDYVTDTRPAAPMVASRLNAGGNLKERIESIMTGNCNCRLSFASKLLVLVLALGVLPFSLRAVQAADEQPVSAASDLAVPSTEPVSPYTLQLPPKTTPTIDAQLEAPVKVQFTEIALEDALHRLSDAANVDIVLDSAALDREGVAPDVPVTISLRKPVSLKSALNLILKPLRLTYVAEDEVVKVTRLLPPIMAGAPPSTFAPVASVTPVATVSPVSDVSPVGAAAPVSALAPVATVAQAAPAASDADLFAKQPAASTAQPERTAAAMTPYSEAPLSISVWRRIVDSNSQKYQRAQELAKKAAISAGELEQVKTDFEISLARFQQAQRALKYYQLQVELAEVEYQQALTANRSGAGAVSDLEVRKLKIKVELAKAKLSELSE